MAGKRIPKRNEFIITAGITIVAYGVSVVKKALSVKKKIKRRNDTYGNKKCD